MSFNKVIEVVINITMLDIHIEFVLENKISLVIVIFMFHMTYPLLHGI
jgi:hypothetical protein